MDKRIAWLLLAGLLVACAWLWWNAGENAGTATSQPSAATDAGEPGAPAAADLAAAEAGQARAPASAASAAPTQPAAAADPSGELVIHVVWAGGEPAPGVHVFVARAFLGAPVPLAQCVTDAAGTARAHVPAGKVVVSSD